MQDFKGIKVHRVIGEQLVFKVYLVLKEAQELLAHLDFKEHREHKVLKVLKVR